MKRYRTEMIIHDGFIGNKTPLRTSLNKKATVNITVLFMLFRNEPLLDGGILCLLEILLVCWSNRSVEDETTLN